MNKLKEEKREHDKIYERASKQIINDPISWERYRRKRCVPPEKGGGLYGRDNKIFLNKVEKELEKRDPKNTVVLDYGCGMGDMALLAAKKGFRARGFDISEKGIEKAKKWSEISGVSDKTKLDVASAEKLPYDKKSFDVVLGKAVIHHTIKYENTGSELARVMKRGAKGLFSEGAASNPIIRLSRKVTIKEEMGDVPLNRKKLKRWSSEFEKVKIDGYFFIYMIKRFGFTGNSDKRSKNVIGKQRHLKNSFRSAENR
ncbi:class I SAM-dependent methyltransferase [Salinibacter pepae]|uniref:class I SAM-dependent methyltransferase n=1 Tax=Salinibacter pepae TaxID=3040382 RepID=UPI0021E8473C|nr:class I SAM-dependent methyltransferase [Salinibacter pepae]